MAGGAFWMKLAYTLALPRWVCGWWSGRARRRQRAAPMLLLLLPVIAFGWRHRAAVGAGRRPPSLMMGHSGGSAP